MSIEAFVGRVSEELVAPGSKSERIALVLTTDDGQKYVLRNIGGPAFGADSALDALIGKRIKVKGAVMSGVLMMHEYSIDRQYDID